MQLLYSTVAFQHLHSEQEAANTDTNNASPRNNSWDQLWYCCSSAPPSCSVCARGTRCVLARFIFVYMLFSHAYIQVQVGVPLGRIVDGSTATELARALAYAVVSRKVQ
jgi:hypothetical protein